MDIIMGKKNRVLFSYRTIPPLPLFLYLERIDINVSFCARSRSPRMLVTSEAANLLPVFWLLWVCVSVKSVLVRQVPVLVYGAVTLRECCCD